MGNFKTDVKLEPDRGNRMTVKMEKDFEATIGFSKENKFNCKNVCIFILENIVKSKDKIIGKKFMISIRMSNDREYRLAQASMDIEDLISLRDNINKIIENQE